MARTVASPDRDGRHRLTNVATDIYELTELDRNLQALHVLSERTSATGILYLSRHLLSTRESRNHSRLRGLVLVGGPGGAAPEVQP